MIMQLSGKSVDLFVFYSAAKLLLGFFECNAPQSLAVPSFARLNVNELVPLGGCSPSGMPSMAASSHFGPPRSGGCLSLDSPPFFGV